MSGFDYAIQLRHKGKAGDVVTVSTRLEYLYRIDGVMPSDSEKSIGTKTSYRLIGGNPSFRLTANCKPHPLGSGVKYPNIKAGGTIAFEVEFLVDCTWRAEIVGKAVKA